jgi:hypothetical protein
MTTYEAIIRARQEGQSPRRFRVTNLTAESPEHAGEKAAGMVAGALEEEGITDATIDVGPVVRFIVGPSSAIHELAPA